MKYYDVSMQHKTIIHVRIKKWASMYYQLLLIAKVVIFQFIHSLLSTWFGVVAKITIK